MKALADVSVHPLDFVSVLVEVEDDGRLRYRGTAFPSLTSGRWLTAGHCVEDWHGPDTMALISTTSQPSFHALVVDVARHPTLDLALLSAVHPATPVFPIAMATWGNEVSVVGYPEDLFLDRDGKDRPRARLLKGHIQRVERPGKEADEEGDFELSFACPGGLSGSPVVGQVSQSVVGIVVGNRESSIVTDFHEVKTGQSVERFEVRRSVSFGAAVDLGRAGSWLSGSMVNVGGDVASGRTNGAPALDQ